MFEKTVKLLDSIGIGIPQSHDKIDLSATADRFRNGHEFGAILHRFSIIDDEMVKK
jgi:hypothetical protein